MFPNEMFLLEKTLTVCEIGFKIERWGLIVKYQYLLTDTFMMDTLKMFLKRKVSHIQQKFHREK